MTFEKASCNVVVMLIRKARKTTDALFQVCVMVTGLLAVMVPAAKVCWP